MNNEREMAEVAEMKVKMTERESELQGKAVEGMAGGKQAVPADSPPPEACHPHHPFISHYIHLPTLC